MINPPTKSRRMKRPPTVPSPGDCIECNRPLTFGHPHLLCYTCNSHQKTALRQMMEILTHLIKTKIKAAP